MPSYQEASAALGDLTIAFQNLEHELTEVFANLSNPNDPVIALIIASKTSFSNLLSILNAICRYRTNDSEVLALVDSILSEANELEQRRNTYTHSFYDVRMIAGDQVEYERIKKRLNKSKGYSPDYETYDPLKVHEVAKKMYELAGRVTQFTEILEAKGIIQQRNHDS